jgi:hypothetical protein
MTSADPQTHRSLHTNYLNNLLKIWWQSLNFCAAKTNHSTRIKPSVKIFANFISQRSSLPRQLALPSAPLKPSLPTAQTVHSNRAAHSTNYSTPVKTFSGAHPEKPQSSTLYICLHLARIIHKKGRFSFNQLIKLVFRQERFGEAKRGRPCPSLPQSNCDFPPLTA